MKSEVQPYKPGAGCLWAFLFVAGIGIAIASIGGFFDTPMPKNEKTRHEIVEGFFDPLDGVHTELERAIKASLNDPDSYEHISTSYRDANTEITVISKFRAKNGFGALTLNTADATIDGKDGHLIDWKIR